MPSPPIPIPPDPSKEVCPLSPRKLIPWLICIAALLAARCLARAESAAEWLEPGALTWVSLDDGERTFAFTARAGSVYDICCFPGDGGAGDVTARLFREGELVAEGAGRLTALSERLSAGTVYTLTLSGAGRVGLEVARHALGRCFDQPLTLSAAGDDYQKAIARSGDVHWYAVDAEGGALSLTGLPEEPGLRLTAMLFDADGRLRSEAEGTPGGAFTMDCAAGSGPCRIRVSAPEGGTGFYSLSVWPLTGGAPEQLRLSEAELQLSGHETRQLRAEADPPGAVYWESSDVSVAQVTQSGAVTGMRAGTAVVTAYAPGGARAHCLVTVASQPARGIETITARIDMSVGDDVSLEWRLIPENATETAVSFTAVPEGVVTVDDSGVVRAVAEGEAVVTLHTADGGYEDTAAVRVHPAQSRHRALLIGEKNYSTSVAGARLGSANSVAGFKQMLEGLSFNGARFEVTTRLDLTRQEALSAIGEAFAGASDRDTALLYITCHGFYRGGMTCLQMVDGSVLTAQALRQALDAVPGHIVVMVDCCGSGGVIGRAGSPDDILSGILDVFSGAPGPSVFSSSRYRVLASASVEQDSYRISFDAQPAEATMATAFARAVCEGCGWSLDRASRGALRADINGDGVVTLDELARYAARRVMWYLSLTGSSYAQCVRAFPEGDVASLFERTGM